MTKQNGQKGIIENIRIDKKGFDLGKNYSQLIRIDENEIRFGKKLLTVKYESTKMEFGLRNHSVIKKCILV